MPKQIHLIAGLLATLTIATFFLSTVLVGLFGSPEAVASVKTLIVMPGLFVLVPAIAAAKKNAVYRGERASGFNAVRHFP
jgi:hypothetical protein